MNNTSELNKYDKKTLELQKESLFIQNGAEKGQSCFLGGLLLNNPFVFLHMKKIGTNFAYFDNTAKSKAKVQQ